MEGQTQGDMHPQRTKVGTSPILNSRELDIIEAALLLFGAKIPLTWEQDNLDAREATANALKKMGEARKAGCCDAVRLFGM